MSSNPVDQILSAEEVVGNLVPLLGVLGYQRPVPVVGTVGREVM
jgi:hypothetical protein